MRRREFIAAIGAATVARPFATRAQQGGRVRRVGVFVLGEPDQPSVGLQVMRDELQKLGWIEGRNLRLEVRFVGVGDNDRTRAAATDLVRLAPDVIVTVSGATLSQPSERPRRFRLCLRGPGTPSNSAG
jgi:putative tryptophan/tyrosine transport system substrate-binding protein